jgi:hypothetical protein
VTDFEALLVPAEKDERGHNEGESYTQTLHQHEPCGFCLFAVSADPEEQMHSPNNPMASNARPMGVG